jgi:hypothetical protein
MSDQGDPINWFSPHQRAILADLSYVDLQLLVRHCRKPMDDDKDAEIERLKKLHAQTCIDWQNDLDRNKALLTECADALEGPRFDVIYQRELVQRLREAIHGT